MEKLTGGVSLEIATKEVNSWLEFKKVKQNKIEAYKESIKSLASYIADGTLTLDPTTFVFTQKLDFPVGNESQVKTLEFQPRLKTETRSINIAGAEGETIYIGIVAALTGKPKNIIKTLDTEDFSVAQSIGVFFV